MGRVNPVSERTIKIYFWRGWDSNPQVHNLLIDRPASYRWAMNAPSPAKFNHRITYKYFLSGDQKIDSWIEPNRRNVECSSQYLQCYRPSPRRSFRLLLSGRNHFIVVGDDLNHPVNICDRKFVYIGGRHQVAVVVAAISRTSAVVISPVHRLSSLTTTSKFDGWFAYNGGVISPAYMAVAHLHQRSK